MEFRSSGHSYRRNLVIWRVHLIYSGVGFAIFPCVRLNSCYSYYHVIINGCVRNDVLVRYFRSRMCEQSLPTATAESSHTRRPTQCSDRRNDPIGSGPRTATRFGVVGGAQRRHLRQRESEVSERGCGRQRLGGEQWRHLSDDGTPA